MKKKSFFGRLLQKNYALFIFAVLISMIVWVYMSFSSPNTDATYTISDVPIRVDLSEDAVKEGLEVFTTSTPKATVKVSGTRTVIGSVTENDLTVAAAAGSITSAGTFSLDVNANKRSALGNFTISSYSPTKLSVTVDYRKSSEFLIDKTGVEFELEEGYFGSVTLPYSTITVSGPQTEVLSISKVIAEAKVPGKLKADKEVDAKVVLKDEVGDEISSDLLELSFTTVKAKIEVLPEKTVPVEPVYVNKPEGLDMTGEYLTISPGELRLAAAEDVLDGVTSVKLEAIDFSTLNNVKHKKKLSISIPDGCKNLSGTTTADVTLDFSGFASKTLTVEQITLPQGYSGEVNTKSIEVTVIGPKDDVDKLTASQVSAVVDTSGSSGSTGSVEMPVTIAFKNVDTCWAYEAYQVNVSLTKK